jgi:cell division protein FtsW
VTTLVPRPGSGSPRRRSSAAQSRTRNAERAAEREAALRQLEPAPRRGGRPSGRRSSLFLGLLALVVGLNLIGLVMVLSASAVDSLYDYGSSWYQFQRQAMWLGIGAVVLLVVMRIDYHAWRRFIPLALVGSAGLLVAVLVPGLGIEVNGSSRWLGAGAFRIQPSEIAKLVVLLFVADLLARRSDRIAETRLTLRPVLVVFGLFAVLIMLQPNLGTTVILGVIVLVVLFVSGIPLRPLAALGAVGAGLAAVLAFVEPYRYRRLLAFRDPWADPLNTGYQTIQAQVGIANGGLVGVGLGEGRAKWGFLPYPHTDFIFAIVAEELGLIGALGLVGLFLFLGVLGVRTALAAPDRFGMLLASGVTAWILVQALINVGAVVGVLPITGVPLPFVSFGGSSLLVLMAAAGVLLNVARQATGPAGADRTATAHA